MNRLFKISILSAAVLALTGCASIHYRNGFEEPTVTKPYVKMEEGLKDPANGQIPVAVYNFRDMTGQRKASQNIASLSSAVTQGADAYLVKSLQEVGGGRWFKVLERGGLDNLIKERQLIRQMREQEFGEQAQPLPPLMVAGLLIEGGIIDYNSNTKTGGNGVRYLGIGPHTQYSEDMVVINLRLISTQTGEVLDSVTVTKTILSTGEGISVFTFFDLGTKAFEVDGQQTSNEPGSYAIRSAIELGIAELIRSGEKKGLWRYKPTQTTE